MLEWTLKCRMIEAEIFREAGSGKKLSVLLVDIGGALYA